MRRDKVHVREEPCIRLGPAGDKVRYGIAGAIEQWVANVSALTGHKQLVYRMEGLPGISKRVFEVVMKARRLYLPDD